MTTIANTVIALFAKGKRDPNWDNLMKNITIMTPLSEEADQPAVLAGSTKRAVNLDKLNATDAVMRVGVFSAKRGLGRTGRWG